jgi:hypothetical protein
MASDIVVGSADGVLEAKMQLDLPSGPRIIKCFAGSSLVDVQNALASCGLLTADQTLVKGGGPVAPLSLDTPVASLNRCKLQIICRAPAAAAAAAAAAPPSAAVASSAAAVASIGRHSPPPELNKHVGIDAAELEKRKAQMVVDMKRREDDAKRILAAHEQEQKDRALEKKMIQDKIIADEQKKRNAVEAAGAPLDRIIIGDTAAGSAILAKIRVQTQGGGVEVTCYDADATMGTLRAILVGKGLCSQGAPIIQAMQQSVSCRIIASFCF